MNPFIPFLEHQHVVILDGGMGTCLEALGMDITHELWSSYLLRNQEGLEFISKVHYDFIENGADAIITSTYQASVPHFQKTLNLDLHAAEELFLSSVRVAVDARDRYWNHYQSQIITTTEQSHSQHRLKPLILGSIGCYGAFEGLEYTGVYGSGVSKQDLINFHRHRIQLLLRANVDCLAFETIPNKLEVEACVKLMSTEFPEAMSMLTVSCRNGQCLSSGESIEEFVQITMTHPNIIAVGVNCTEPWFIEEIIHRIAAITKNEKLLVCYPNSGERYEKETSSWHLQEKQTMNCWEEWSRLWFSAGARIIGGCCRTFPEHIQRIRKTLISQCENNI